MSKRFLLGIVLLGFLSVQRAFADTYAEVGDAGQLPGTAQSASGGANPLTQITGALGLPNDVDMFKILITGAFRADTFGTEALVGGLFNPMLFLFDAGGLFLAGNDDCGVAPNRFQSCIPFPFPTTMALAPGPYYLAISAHPNFPNNCCGLGGPPVTGWDAVFFDTPVNIPYIINLTGAEFVPAGVPEPGTLFLLSTGLLGLAGYRKKQLRRKPSS